MAMGGVVRSYNVLFQAEWRKMGAQTQYLETNEINNWIVLSDGRNRALVDRFVTMLMTTARKKGMIFSKLPAIIPFTPNTRNSWPEMFERCVNKNVEFIM